MQRHQWHCIELMNVTGKTKRDKRASKPLSEKPSRRNTTSIKSKSK
jgi:hypothetical protein